MLWTTWAGNFTGTIIDQKAPTSLAELVRVVRDAEALPATVHAMGSAWAFSAPAYCPGIIVSTSLLNRFLNLGPALPTPARAGGRRLVAVEAGIKVRDLYLGLDGRARRGFDELPSAVRALSPTGGWTLTTIGGAGGQSIAGAVSTGTHGGDVARPPIGDGIKAAIVVGSGGRVSLVQRRHDAVVDRAALEAVLGEPIMLHDEPDDLDAVIVSAGRFGVIYAVVLEVEPTTVIREERVKGPWSALGPALTTLVTAAVTNDEFLQIVINPYPTDLNDRTCYLTQRFNAMPIRVATPPYIRGSSLFQVFCSDTHGPELEVLEAALLAMSALAVQLAFQFIGPFAFLAGIPFWRAIESLRRIGPNHRLGDAITDILNFASSIGAGQIIQLATGVLLGSQQAVGSTTGTRYELGDQYDYDRDCFRGDSVEVFFPVNAALQSIVEAVFGVYTQLAEAGHSIGGYIALRFMSASSALLSLTPGAQTCAIEVSLLRGQRGNEEALRLLQELAVARGGRVHWGQQNDLTEVQVEAMYGRPLMTRWRDVLRRIEGTSRTFSTPFTQQRGLELTTEAADAWLEWADLGLVAATSPSAVSAWSAAQGVEVFALDRSRQLVRFTVPRVAVPPGTPTPWVTVGEPRTMAGRPVVLRSVDGRVEVFLRADDGRVSHTWEEGAPGGTFAGWNELGGWLEPPNIEGDPDVAKHRDGRLELFARGAFRIQHRLHHVWQHIVNGRWSDFVPLGATMGGPPSAALRIHSESAASTTTQLVVVAASDEGRIVFMAQHGPRSNSGWNEAWFPVSPDNAPTTNEPILHNFVGPDGGLRVLAIGGDGELYEARDTDHLAAVTWHPWQSLPRLADTPLGPLAPHQRLSVIATDHVWVFGRLQSGAVACFEYVPASMPSAGGVWRAPQSLGGRVVGDLTAAVDFDGRILVFARRAGDDHVMGRRQRGRNTW